MDLIAAILRQIWALLLNPRARRGGIEAMMAEAEEKLAHMILERALARVGRSADLDRFACRLVWRDGFPDFVIALRPGVLTSGAEDDSQFHPRMLRRLPSRRPRLPNRWNKRKTTAIRRMEHRRNRRWVRTFIHARPIAPMIRAPRVVIPPWLFG